MSKRPTRNVQVMNKFISFIKKHKLATILLILFFLSIIANNILEKEEPPSKEVVSQPTPTPIPENYKPQEIKRLYNSVEVNGNVSGFSWINDNLYYSNNDGIYDAKSNAQLLSKKISEAKWNNEGFLIYSSDSNWNLFDIRTNTDTVLPIENAQKISLSSTGNTVLYSQNNTLKTFNRINNESYETSFGEEIINIKAISDSRFYAQTRNAIYTLDSSLNTQSSINTNKLGTMVDVNIDQEVILVSSNIVSILDLLTGNINSFAFRESANIQASWISPNEAIVVEYTIDNIGRRNEHIWGISGSSRTYLTNTLPIPWKLQAYQPLFTNKNREVIGLIDRNGQLWLLTLNSDKLPVYNESGLSLIEIKQENQYSH